MTAEMVLSEKNINIQDKMEQISQAITKCNDVISNYEVKKGEESIMATQIHNCMKIIDINTELVSIFSKAGEVLRDKAKLQFEKIVTDALQFVTQDSNTKFIIEESIVRGKPAYEFYVETLVNGEVCKQKPEDACGGGFVDIISVTLKYAYLQIFNNPSIKNASIILDEPGKMISEQMSVKFAEYIRFLGKHFDKQTIMITHNENLSSVADKTFLVSKNRNGISTAVDFNVMFNDMAASSLTSEIDKSVEEKLNENNNE